MLWHTEMINKAIEISLQQVQIAIQKAKFWDRAREYALNKRQIKVLNRLLDAGVDGFEGGLSTKKYISIAKTSPATAKRDIADLLSKNLISQVEGLPLSFRKPQKRVSRTLQGVQSQERRDTQTNQSNLLQRVFDPKSPGGRQQSFGSTA